MRTTSFHRIALICACAFAALAASVWLAGKVINAAYGDQPDWAGSGWTVRCPNDPNATSQAKILLTKCEITETAIEIGYEIHNDSDHQIWVCDGVLGADSYTYSSFFEVGLDAPKHTLLVKKHINIPLISAPDWYISPLGIYLRILPGEKHLGVFSQALPLHRRWSFRTECDVPGIIDLTRIVVDVHYYDGNLPELIRAILTEAERFTGTLSPDWRNYPDDIDVVRKYFPGLVLKTNVGGLDRFNDWYGEDVVDGKLEMSFDHYDFLEDDDVLRLTLDGVSVPFEIP